MRRGYYGVDGVARRISAGYVGVVTQIPIYETTTTQTEVKYDNYEQFFSTNIGTSDPWYVFQNAPGKALRFCIDDGSSNWAANEEYLLLLSAETALKGVTLTLIAQYTTAGDNNLLTLNYGGSTLYTVSGVAVPTVDNGGGAVFRTCSLGDVPARGHFLLRYRTVQTQTIGTNPNCVSLTISAYTETEKQTQTGTQTRSVARKIVKAYVGDANGKARRWM